MQPIQAELYLDYHGRLVDKVGKGITHSKKRLHDAELVLNLEPVDSKELGPQEQAEWKAKIDRLVRKRDDLVFPSVLEIRKEYLQKELDNEALQAQELKRFTNKDRFSIRNQINSTQQRAQAAINSGHGFKNQTYKEKLAEEKRNNEELKMTEIAGFLKKEDDDDAIPVMFSRHDRGDGFHQVSFKASARDPRWMTNSEARLRMNVTRRKDEVRDLQATFNTANLATRTSMTALTPFNSSTVVAPIGGSSIPHLADLLQELKEGDRQWEEDIDLQSTASRTTTASSIAFSKKSKRSSRQTATDNSDVADDRSDKSSSNESEVSSEDSDDESASAAKKISLALKRMGVSGSPSRGKSKNGFRDLNRSRERVHVVSVGDGRGGDVSVKEESRPGSSSSSRLSSRPSTGSSVLLTRPKSKKIKGKSLSFGTTQERDGSGNARNNRMKLAMMGEGGFRVKDYTMEGLSLQVESKIISYDFDKEEEEEEELGDDEEEDADAIAEKNAWLERPLKDLFEPNLEDYMTDDKGEFSNKHLHQTFKKRGGVDIKKYIAKPQRASISAPSAQGQSMFGMMGNSSSSIDNASLDRKVLRIHKQKRPSVRGFSCRGSTPKKPSKTASDILTLDHLAPKADIEAAVTDWYKQNDIYSPGFINMNKAVSPLGENRKLEAIILEGLMLEDNVHYKPTDDLIKINMERDINDIIVNPP